MGMQYTDLMFTCDKLRKQNLELKKKNEDYEKQLLELQKRFDDLGKDMERMVKKLKHYEKIEKEGLILNMDLKQLISDSMINMFRS